MTRCLPGHLGSPGYRLQQFEPPEPPAEKESKPEAEAKKEEAKAAPPQIAPPEKLPDAEGDKNMRQVNVPFYDGEVRVFLKEKVFGSAFADWRISNDSSRGKYGVLSDGFRNRLVERFIYAASRDIRQVLPNIPNQPSPFREELGGRIWLEVARDNAFGEAKEYVEKLKGRGMHNYVMVVPTWQLLGPSGGSPTHFPAKGKEEVVALLEELGVECGKAGVRFALQEEYSDMWPDYEKFSERYLALSSEGTPSKGCTNGRAPLPENRESFHIKPELMAKFAADEGRTIHRGHDTSAAYLNRHSSNPLSRGIDYTAGAPGAGQARTICVANAKLFEQARGLHEGPVLGRGGSHWIYSGLIDGASAQPGAGWEAKKGQELPLLVDFDLLRMHPLGVTYGMGDMESWRMAPPTEEGGIP